MKQTRYQEQDIKTLRCGLGRRAMVMLYDSLIVTALLFIAVLLALPLTGDSRQVLHDPLLTAWVMLVWFVYLGWCWTHGGQTVGMRAWRVGLVLPDGGAMSWRQSIIRFLVSLVSAAVLGAGFLWAFSNPQRATWHDLASKSRLHRLPSPVRTKRSD